MKRNENTPYMHNHNYQNPIYNTKEGGLRAKKEKKRGKHLCLLGISWWTVLLP